MLTYDLDANLWYDGMYLAVAHISVVPTEGNKNILQLGNLRKQELVKL